jgi:hypothetical protein
MTDFEYRKTLVVGAIIGASIMLLAFYWAKSSSETPSPTPKTNFAVVDTYKGCDVVQWTDHHMATYKYFLDCSK